MAGSLLISPVLIRSGGSDVRPSTRIPGQSAICHRRGSGEWRDSRGGLIVTIAGGTTDRSNTRSSTDRSFSARKLLTHSLFRTFADSRWVRRPPARWPAAQRGPRNGRAPANAHRSEPVPRRTWRVLGGAQRIVLVSPGWVNSLCRCRADRPGCRRWSSSGSTSTARSLLTAAAEVSIVDDDEPVPVLERDLTVAARAAESAEKFRPWAPGRSRTPILTVRRAMWGGPKGMECVEARFAGSAATRLSVITASRFKPDFLSAGRTSGRRIVVPIPSRSRKTRDMIRAFRFIGHCVRGKCTSKSNGGRL